MKLVIGCGYVGHRVARQWRKSSDEVTVLTRSKERAQVLKSEGFEVMVADVTQPTTLTDLPVASTVLYAVGYDRRQPLSIEEVYAGGVKHVLDALPHETGRIIYISSTGVYGDAEGEWIDEETVPIPSRSGGRASLAAEQVLFAHPLGDRGIVLRLAGIYGPGRVPRREDILVGKPIVGNPHGVLNLIHIDDVVQVILTAEEHAIPPRTYNVSDGNPTPRHAYYETLSRLLDAPSPQFVPPSEEDSERSRGAADKRVSNQRMLRELEIQLQYHSFREGLAAIAQAD